MNWTPPNFYDNQWSTTGADADDCVEQAICHAVYMKTGKRYSPRALAWATDVSPNGSEVSKAIQVANTVGLIPYELWPNLETFTWSSYYKDVPPEILAKAEKLDIELVPADLNVSPLLVELEFNPTASFPGPYHLVAQFSPTQYFDSERWNGDSSPIRNLDFLGAKVIWSSSIKINKPPKMTNVEFIHKAGTQEFAFYVPATSIEALKDKALNFGLSIVKPDGSIDFSQAKVVTFN